MELLKLMRGDLSGGYSCNASEEIISLMKSGYDINTVTDLGLSPLHFAISRNMPDLVLKLIELGADINLPDNYSEATPLQHAVRFRSCELVCMLLCYGADVTAVDCDGMTPIMTALDMGEEEISRILFDFYDDFTQINNEGCDCVWFAAKMKNPIVIDLLNSNLCVPNIDSEIFIFSLLYNDSQLFKLIWATHSQVVLDVKAPFLLHYLRLCQFDEPRWVECFYLILSCSLNFELVDQYRDYIELHPAHNVTFFQYMYVTFNKLKVHLNDRLKILCMCLSLGIKPNFKDLCIVYHFYKFTDELEILIHAGGSFSRPSRIENLNELLMLYLLGMERQKEIAHDKLVSECLRRELARWTPDLSIINFLQYVFVNVNVKKSLHMICSSAESGIQVSIDAINNSPSCPSLLNLARNTIRHCLLTPMEVPYQFFDKVNCLLLPKTLKNVVCFREPVYR